MKATGLFLLMTLTYSTYAQDLEINDEKKIKNVINRFFRSLETRDTLLMKQTTMGEAQIWRRKNNKKPIEIDTRLSKDDLQEMPNDPIIKEIPLSFKILVDDGIAVAWVPYKLWVDDKFSHCGIDVFTLFEMEGTWKIISMAYTIEIQNCDE